MFILLLLVAMAIGKQMKEDDLEFKTYHERIPNTNYRLYTNQTLTLTYEAYEGVFEMSLKQKDFDPKIENYTPDHYEQFVEEPEGCYTQQRELTVGSTLSVDLATNDAFYYSDFLATKQRVFLLRSDYQLHQIDIKLTHLGQISSLSREDQYRSLLTHLQTTQNENIINGKLFLRKVHNEIFIFTDQGALSFNANKQPIHHLISPNRSIHDTDFEFQKQNGYKQKLGLVDVTYSSQHNVMLVGSTFGIDIYGVQENQLHLKKTIEASVLKVQQVNILDISISEDSTYLYVLDAIEGFIILNFENILSPYRLKFNFQIPKLVAFDHYHQTFIFVAQDTNNQDYAVEVFINQEKGNHYINRYYRDEMKVFDVQMFEHYAVLIGYDAHKLIYHSIYQGFFDLRREHHTFFTESGLMEVSEFEIESKTETQIIGLSQFEFKTFRIQFVQPRIVCHSKESSKMVYLLQMNSTNCNTKSAQHDKSQFNQCQITHPFIVEVDQVYLTSENKWMVFVVGVVLIVTVVSLIWTLFLCWKRWGKEILDLERQKQQLEKEYNNLPEQQDIKEEQA